MRGQSEPIPTAFPGLIELLEMGHSWRDLKEMPDAVLWELLARRGWDSHYAAEKRRVDAEQARQHAQTLRQGFK